ncbi:hypothetical protein BsWGS_18482 [Bradybaena similaris]
MTSLAALTFLLLLTPTAESSTTTSTTSIGSSSVATGASTDTTTMSTGSTSNTTLTSMSTSNSTSNFSSITENTTASTPTTTTTTTTTTTVAPKPDIPHGTDITLYVLKLTVSNTNSSDIQYRNANITRDELLSKLNEKFNFSFSNDLLVVNNGQVPAMYVLEVSFREKDIVNNTGITNSQITAALNSLSVGEFAVPNITLTNMKVAQFLNSTMDPCAAENVCPVGYNCLVDGCRFMCSDKDCSHHGTCYISVTANATASAMCMCDSEYATEYMGDNCQYSRRGRLEIIAIIAGVLGAVCLILIIVIIVLCIKYNRTSPSSNYNVSSATYDNNAYDGVPQK